MIRVYIAENLADAHLVSNLVRSCGIKTHVFNEFANGAVGELPFTHTWPEVWIENDRDEARALEIIENRGAAVSSDENLSCTECGQNNPANFGICWNCAAPLTEKD